MNILILGCSFGVPNYRGPGQHEHTEFRLRKLGYTVYNCSLNGGSNLRTIDLAESYLNGEGVILEPRFVKRRTPGVDHTEYINPINPKIDWVLWFHTELARDASDTELSSGAISHVLNTAAEKVYNTYAQFIKKLGARVAVIGGAGDVLPILYQHIQPDFCIPSWRNYIFKESLPSMNFLGKLEKLNLVQDTTENKMLLLQQHEFMRNKLANSNFFPDGYHPGAGPHSGLTEVLHRVFQA